MELTKRKIMVVSAHGADWCTRSGGTLIRYLNAGSEVEVVALSFGERGESGEYWKQNPNGTVEACKECRKKEAQDAADFLGVKISFLDYNDYPLLLNVEQIRDLTYRILDFRPDIILTHWTTDPINVDHEVAAHAAVRAASGAAMLGARPNTPVHFFPDIFMFEGSLPHTEFNEFKMDTYVDISDVLDKKLEAVAKFKCQPHLVEYYRKCGTTRGEQATNWARGRKSIPYAEGFRRFVPYVGMYLPATNLMY